MGSLLVLAALLGTAPVASAALVDVWRADDLNLNDGDTVGTWSSASNRTATAVVGFPVLKRNVTPAGSSAVRFNRNRLYASSSPAGGRTAFSVAYVFRADAVGANDSGNNWYGKTGIVDAEQGGVTADWGTVITETGNLGIGIGSGDTSLYSTGPSLVDSNYHVAVFTWGGGSQAVYVDTRARVSVASPTAARNAAGFSFGGIHTDENGAVRRFVGDLVEVRFYDTALSSVEASNVIAELTDYHILGKLPVIRSFTANTNRVMIGNPATLSWFVTNATALWIDNGIGVVSAPTGSVPVTPFTTTTYTLTASNEFGVRSALVTINVDPGIPVAHPQTVAAIKNTPVNITLTGSDPNGNSLTYSVVTRPQRGDLTGTPPDLVYAPTNDYFGNDFFTFKVNDGTNDSPAATVTIRIEASPTSPSAIVLSSTNINANAGPGQFLATLRAIDANPLDTHTFALVAGPGDTHNSLFAVAGTLLVGGPGYGGPPGTNYFIRLRATDNTGLTCEQALVLRTVEIELNIVINEIHYNGPDNTVRDEFIELYNPKPTAVDLSLWRVRGGVDFFFPQGTVLPSGGFLVVAQNPGVIFANFGIAAFGPWEGQLNNEGEDVALRDPADRVMDRVAFRSEFPWPIAANGEGGSMELINPSLDNDLGSSWATPRNPPRPSPGRTNQVFAHNAAPNLRQVQHTPEQPASSNTVVITAKVTDPEGVVSVTLSYQIVLPGSYIPATLPLTKAQLDSLNTNPNLTNALNPAFEAATNWITVAMNDDGLDGDAVADDNIYTVTLAPQAHRTLVRYRITVTDTLGAFRRAPFEDDPSLNFAYFVYDGIPAYQGYSSEVLQTLPVYWLITRDADINQCAAWFNTGDQLGQSYGGVRNAGRLHFNWEGAMVYDGVVYDHVEYRLRGANGRYHNGKRSFRIRFNEGHYLDAKDQFGDRFPRKWQELTTGKGQSNQGTESFALNEVINYFLWNKVGVPSPSTFHFHFRVVRGVNETNRYDGDFWGLNWAQEEYDVAFLEAHNLPKGNLYKLVDNFVLGVGEQRYQAPFAVTNAADFYNIENNLTGFQSTNWLLAYANYSNWYRYHAVAEAVRQYDVWPDCNKNGAWYFEPLYTPSNSFLGRMWQLPYDGTDTWGPTWNGGQDVLHNGIFNDANVGGGDSGENAEMQKEYRNVVREVRELLFQPDQINAIIDAFADRIKDFAPADMARWLNAPAPASYSSIGIPSCPGVTGGLAGYVQDMKNFMFVGGSHAWWTDRNSVGAGGWVTRLDTVAADTAIPVRPIATYAGTNGYPLDELVFRSSTFSDPQGAGTFAAMRWRIAEVLTPGTAVSNVAQIKLDWDATWDSGDLTAFNEFITVPSWAVQADHLYRVRVRHKDNTGRWSQWSPPAEFRPSPRDVVSVLRTNLVFAEIMYNPPGEGVTDGDEFEFLEVKNIGPNTLDLSGLFFSTAINFAFTNGTRLAPGRTFLLARNPAVLGTRYPGVVANGTYTGKLNNDGEEIAISHPAAGVILSVTYSDRAPWPVTADGYGFSLVLADPAAGTYRASADALGTPGFNGAASGLGGVVINEVLSSSTLPLRDTIELLNIAATNVDVGGWYLSDDPTTPWKYRIPDGTILEPGHFYVVDDSQFNPTPGQGTSFGLSSFGDEIYLFSADASFQITGYSHGFAFGGAQDGVSFGRYVNRVGEEQFPLQISRTFDAANSGPRVGPVVLSEIHYHPRAPQDEFLELKNLTGSEVPLYDPTNALNTWRVSGLGFDFPASVSIPANGYLLLVADDPTAFRARFHVPLEVPVFQYVGGLQDNGENLELQAPDIPTIDGIPYYAVDTVRYNDRSPWPLSADGAGASLQRMDPAAYGDDPINWPAALPTPGGALPGGTPPAISSQPASGTNVTTATTSFSVGASGSEPLFYQWRFNGNNLEGGTNPTLVLPNLVIENSGRYSVLAFNTAGSAESLEATLLVRVGPTITAHPTNVAVRIKPDPQAAPSTNATFFVGVASYNPPLRYQWHFNGVDIPAATNSSFTVTNVQLANEGTYGVLVTDTVGTLRSATVWLSPRIAPAVTQAPLAQSVVAGGTAVFSVGATGHPLPFSFRWRRNGATQTNVITFEKTNFFVITNVSVTVTGNYSVVVTNLAGQTAATPNAFLGLAADDDGDGLADAWETAFGLSTNNAADRDLDADLDGASNWQEYIAGTDPTNAASFLKVTLNTLIGQAEIAFSAVSNKTYTLQYTDQLDNGAWSKLADILARTNNRVETILDPTWATHRFYRAVTPRQ